MNPHCSTALALPRIPPSIPGELHVAGARRMTVPLALALLEANVITDATFKPASNRLVDTLWAPDERELSMRALSRWWDALLQDLAFQAFKFRLHVQELESCYHARPDGHPEGWFCITRGGDGYPPRFSLAAPAGRLEAMLPGLGQTVLAVLYDALRRLPDSLNPERALDFAHAYYWADSSDDAEYLEMRREDYGYQTVEELLKHENLFTRERFFAEVPEWACRPRRVLSREQIEQATLDDWAREVVAACDAIAAAAATREFRLFKTHEVGGHTAGDCSDAMTVLLWHGPGDRIGDVIDYVIDMLCQTGEDHEFIDARPVPLTRAAVRKYMRRTEQMLRFARLTETLLILIGEEC